MATEASSTNQKPPVPPQGAPCWIEICSTDPEKLKGSSLRLLSSDVLMSRQDFYAALFPAWKFVEKANETAGAPVVHFTFEQPSGLSGGIVKLPQGGTCGEQSMGAGYTVYHFVKSIDEIEKEIVKLGGKKVLDKMAEGDNGWFANFVDLEGNRFGVYEAKFEGGDEA